MTMTSMKKAPDYPLRTSRGSWGPFDMLNLDLGRDLQFEDLPGGHSFPIDVIDSGQVTCFDCEPYRNPYDDLQPLTRSSGIFTSLTLCENDAPVYLCLKHAPRDIFSKDAAALLELQDQAHAAW